MSGHLRPSVPIPHMGSEQARGLMAWYVAMDGPGFYDPLHGHTVPYVANAAGRKYLTPFGPAIDATANNTGARADNRASLNNLLPVSLMCVFWQVAAGAANGDYFNITFTSTDTTPFAQYCIEASGAGTGGLSYQYNNAGANVEVNGATVPANARLHVGVLSLQTGAQALYLDGVSVASSANAIASISSSGTPVVGIGVPTSDVTTRNCGARILDCRIWNRALTASEAQAYSHDWADLYKQPRRKAIGKRAATGTVHTRWYYDMSRAG